MITDCIYNVLVGGFDNLLWGWWVSCCTSPRLNWPKVCLSLTIKVMKPFHIFKCAKNWRNSSTLHLVKLFFEKFLFIVLFQFNFAWNLSTASITVVDRYGKAVKPDKKRIGTCEYFTHTSWFFDTIYISFYFQQKIIKCDI